MHISLFNLRNVTKNSFIKDAKLNKLNLRGSFPCYFEFPMSEPNRFVEFGEVLELVKNESAHSQVIITLRQIEVEQLVCLCYFQSSRKQILAWSSLSSSIVLTVVLVLYLSEDFLHEVFHRDNSARSAKLVDNNCKRTFLTDKDAQQFLGIHRFRHDCLCHLCKQ